MKICHNFRQQVIVLNRLKKIMPFELRTDFYYAFIALHYNYCSESWHDCGKRGSGKLAKINERALRFVTRDKSTTYEMLLKQVNLLSHLIKELLIWPPSFTKLSLGIKSLEVPRGAENKYNHLWT